MFFIFDFAYNFQVDVASIFLVDSTNDLGITLHMEGYRPVVAKFPRAESFSSVAKLNGSKYYLSETLSLHPETSSGISFPKKILLPCASIVCIY